MIDQLPSVGFGTPPSADGMNRLSCEPVCIELGAW